MTPKGWNDADPPQALLEFRFPGFEVSWAGEGGSTSEFCFGSEGGGVLFVTIENSKVEGPILLADSGEAVNGVALLPGSLAVSTRSEVAIWKGRGGHAGDDEAAIYDGGAHGVTSTPSGFYYAPLGASGLLAARPQPGDFQEFRIIRAADRPINFYKAAWVNRNNGADVLVCAARRDGLITVVHGPTSRSFLTLCYPGLDAIDVCPLGSRDLPFAAAGLGADGSVFLIRDVFNSRQPQTLRLGTFQERAYRILAINKYLLILSSERIYILLDVLENFYAGIPVDGPLRFRYRDLQAVDAAAAFDRWLLIVLPDGGVFAVDIRQQPGGGEYTASTASHVSQPLWENAVFPDLEYAAT